MTKEEVLWRARSAVRDLTDRWRYGMGLPLPAPRPSVDPGVGFVEAPARDIWSGIADGDSRDSWAARLVQRADEIVAHRLTFLGLDAKHLGDPIDWNRDHASGRPAPMTFAPWIDYRDFAATGDAKLVWEPNRHQHFVVLARAFRATGDHKYVDALAEQMTSWHDQCPYATGMNWRSPLELAIRLINWVWALELCRASARWPAGFIERVSASAHLHLWEITRKYSRASSANNHLIGEAAGVFIAASYFPFLDPDGAWRRDSRTHLLREIEEQTYPDGANREQAFGYHLFVLEFFLYAALAARASGEPFPQPYWATLERQMEFVSALGEAGGFPFFGDADDGYVLDLGDGRCDPRGLLAVGAALFGRSDFKAGARGAIEPVYWLLGTEGVRAFDAIVVPPASPLTCHEFAASGYYLLQSGGAPDRISVLFDCGELGMGSLAAHGHADALSITLRAFDRDILVDSGTYDYFTYPEWRRFFRGTAAHNTVVVDGEDQSVIQGPFLWGQRANCRCLGYEAREDGGRVVAEHDGYSRLADPVVHRRAIDLHGRRAVVVITDEIDAKQAHDVDVYFHFSAECLVAPRSSQEFDVTLHGSHIVLSLDAQLEPTLVDGGSNGPAGGWVGEGYHRKKPASVVRGRARINGNAAFTCRIAVVALGGGS